MDWGSNIGLGVFDEMIEYRRVSGTVNHVMKVQSNLTESSTMHALKVSETETFYWISDECMTHDQDFSAAFFNLLSDYRT